MEMTKASNFLSETSGRSAKDLWMLRILRNEQHDCSGFHFDFGGTGSMCRVGKGVDADGRAFS